MHLQKLRLITLLTLVAIISGAAVLELPVVSTESRVSAQTVNRRKAEADRLFQQGRKQLNISQYEAAIQFYQQALIVYQEIKYRQGEGWALGNIGIAYEKLRNYAKAIDYKKQSLAIAREIKDYKSELQNLINLGRSYEGFNDYNKAIEYYQQCLVRAKEIKYYLFEIKALQNLGGFYHSQGNNLKAIEYDRKSLTLARKIEDRKREGYALNNIGKSYLDLGKYNLSIKYYQQSLLISRELNDSINVSKILNNIGIVYRIIANYDKAIEYHEESLIVARKANNGNSESSELVTLSDLGNVYHNLGEYKKAIDYQLQSLMIAQKINHRQGQAMALGNIGIIYHSSGNYAKAIDYSHKALAIVRKIKHFNFEAATLGNLGLTYYYLGNYPKAIDYLQQYLRLARKIQNPKLQSTALRDLGITLYKSGKLSAAESTLFEGIQVLESLRSGLNDANKVSIFDTQLFPYNALQQVLIAQNKTDTALEIAERGRARAFVELLASRLNIKEKPQEPKIEQIKQIAKAQNATLVQYSIIYDHFKIAGKQQPKELELYIWVVKPTGEVTFRKADLKPLWQKENTNLNKLVINSRESIGAKGRSIKVTYDPDAGKAQNNLKQLHKLLIKPIADVLPKNSSARVIFIPQSSLFLVPFPALQDENGKYLIEKHTILTSPSIQVLNLTRQQRKSVETRNFASLIVGNPKMPKVPPKIGEPPQQLTPLPAAETEAKAIASLLNTKPLIGSQATESEVVKRLPQARIIHLATHGIFNDVQGLNSGIALTASGRDDGLLTAGEIFDLKLNADLVVLSACDTGRGKITGDGVIGLSRSFISAGVPSVLVSLWSVPDAPTASLMTEFYKNLSKNPDKATALRQAMLTTMKQHPAPKDWAAFTLIGEAD